MSLTVEPLTSRMRSPIFRDSSSGLSSSLKGRKCLVMYDVDTADMLPVAGSVLTDREREGGRERKRGVGQIKG